MLNEAPITPTDHKIISYYLGIPVRLPELVDSFRHLFDPKYEVNEAHATLVAPFPADLMSDDLDHHFASTIAQFNRRNIIASDFYITPRGHIFYTFDMQSDQLLSELYDRLHHYSSLESRKDRSRVFLPHITIGKFDGERDVPRLVRSTLPEICERHEIFFDRVRLYGILDAPKMRAHVKDYLLSTES